ncbi:MAG: T9SS type A sorting domain-containing protein [Candidatus Kariarchaeaceae archaeon]
MDRKNSGADTGPTSGHEYYNNVFYNVGGGSGYRGSFWFRGADDIKFHHNTIYSRDILEAEIFELVNNAENASFMDNVVTLRGNKGLFSVEEGSSASFDYNCYHNRDGVVSKVGVNDTIADPLFVNVNDGDLKLQNNSPCIDTGINVGILDDFVGNSRPIGVGFDMGAYEFDPASTIFIENQIPSGFRLKQNYPNPFNPVTIIQFTLPKSDIIYLEIFDMSGQLVQTLVHDYVQSGMHKIVWNASSQSSGIYLCRLSFRGQTETRKMILLR